MQSPQTFSVLKATWRNSPEALIQPYIRKETQFIAELLPEDAIAWPTRGVLYVLEERLGKIALQQALLLNIPIASPVSHHKNTNWLKTSKMVGINVRTIGSFWNIVKYALTLPESYDAIHLLPIWEPGVVSSLYGITSWHINTEFFSKELYEVLPHLDTTEKQLKATVRVLHLLGKAVGLDIIPHTDRYSEIALANPHLFEWLQRRGTSIVSHEANLHNKVKTLIFSWLVSEGTALGQDVPVSEVAFYSLEEAQRNTLLFGAKEDVGGRITRRNKLIQVLYEAGYENVPATMGPPYRGLAVSKDSFVKDDDGRIWHDFVITKPQSFSRVFGPLSRYKLYEAKDNNANWEIDFSRPRHEVFQYICEHYAEQVRNFSFDFMRGDMSHVQPRPEGVPAQVDNFYDLHKAVKNYILPEKPWFGYFGESFIAPAGEMGYGDEADHLEASDCDSTLGDLQSMDVGSPKFLQALRLYRDLLETRGFAPCFTIMTADKDDPRFDGFYLKGNEARVFTGLFLGDMPAYVGLGFEVRDPHPTPAPNENYTKLYVFHLKEGKNATHGPYRWGQNAPLFQRLTRLYLFADTLLPEIKNQGVVWLLPPDATGYRKTIAWTHGLSTDLIFVVNFDMQHDAKNLKIPNKHSYSVALVCLFSTLHQTPDTSFLSTKKYLQIDSLTAGECRVYGR